MVEKRVKKVKRERKVKKVKRNKNQKRKKELKRSTGQILFHNPNLTWINLLNLNKITLIVMIFLP